MKSKNQNDNKTKEKTEHNERSVIDIINDIADKAMEFTSEKLDSIEDKLQS